MNIIQLIVCKKSNLWEKFPTVHTPKWPTSSCGRVGRWAPPSAGRRDHAQAVIVKNRVSTFLLYTTILLLFVRWVDMVLTLWIYLIILRWPKVTFLVIAILDLHIVLIVTATDGENIWFINTLEIRIYCSLSLSTFKYFAKFKVWIFSFLSTMYKGCHQNRFSILFWNPAVTG